MKKNCVICGNEFEAIKCQKTCGGECSKKMRLLWVKSDHGIASNRKSQRKHYDNFKRKFRKKRKTGRGHIIRICPYCKCIFYTKNPRVKYCQRDKILHLNIRRKKETERQNRKRNACPNFRAASKQFKITDRRKERFLKSTFKLASELQRLKQKIGTKNENTSAATNTVQG